MYALLTRLWDSELLVWLIALSCTVIDSPVMHNCSVLNSCNELQML